MSKMSYHFRGVRKKRNSSMGFYHFLVHSSISFLSILCSITKYIKYWTNIFILVNYFGVLLLLKIHGELVFPPQEDIILNIIVILHAHNFYLCVPQKQYNVNETYWIMYSTAYLVLFSLCLWYILLFVTVLCLTLFSRSSIHLWVVYSSHINFADKRQGSKQKRLKKQKKKC